MLGFEWNAASEWSRKLSSQGDRHNKSFFIFGCVHDIMISCSIDRNQLLSALQELRVKEKAMGQALHAEKKAIKEKLKQVA
jgi:hypothetical protein